MANLGALIPTHLVREYDLVSRSKYDESHNVNYRYPRGPKHAVPGKNALKNAAPGTSDEPRRDFIKHHGVPTHRLHRINRRGGLLPPGRFRKQHEVCDESQSELEDRARQRRDCQEEEDGGASEGDEGSYRSCHILW